MKENNEEGQVLLVDKPYRWTSFDVVKKIRSKSEFKKVGHAGTLDPLATGLLIICTGKKTKMIDGFMGLEKEYQGHFVLGKSTPSVDLETDFDGEYRIDHIKTSDLKKTQISFLGSQQQAPPEFSAIKVEGKRSYELARKGEAKPLKPRSVFIRSLEVNAKEFPEIEFKVVCSKGTYIRSMVRDFGIALNCGAYLKDLKRTAIGSYKLENAFSPEEIVNPLKK
jgi:tRNA pseudouridine55 synthase